MRKVLTRVAAAITRRTSGDTASWLQRLSTMPSMKPELLRWMRRSFWSPSKASDSCSEHRASGVESSKGKEQIPAMVARDQERNTADFQLTKLHGKHIRKALLPLIDQKSVLCTDGAAVYDYFARTLGITHHIAHSRRGQRVRQDTTSIPITAD